MIKAGIYGAQGATAATLIKILVFHPDVNLLWVVDQNPPEPLSTKYRVLTGETQLSTTQTTTPPTEVDVVFIAINDGLTAHFVEQLPEQTKVIDLTGAYRYSEDFIYGLPEINRKYMVHDCFRVTCPSACAIIVELALLPLARNLMLTSDVSVTITAAQPIDAAQVEKELIYLLSGVQNSFKHHVHVEAATATQARGITATVKVNCSTALDLVHTLYNDYFDDHNFTFIIDQAPAASDVLGTNKCLLHLQHDGWQLTVTAAIDDLIKGDAGTAVHCMNLLFGLHERVGLETF